MNIKITALIFVMAFSAVCHAFVVNRVNSSPEINGVLDDKVWTEATKIELKGVTGANLKNSTLAYIGYDQTNLYVAFKCEESHMKKIKSNWTFDYERDNTISHDDCVEIFLSPLSSQVDLYHIIINSRGVIYDAKNNDVIWDCDIQRAVHIDKDFWSVEVLIPIDEFGHSLKGGEHWGINLCREEKVVPELSSLNGARRFNDIHSLSQIVFEREKKDLQVDVISLLENDKNQVVIETTNSTGSSIAYKIGVKALLNGETVSFEEKNGEALKGQKSKSILPYNDKTETLEIVVKDAAANNVFYQNVFNFLSSGNPSAGSERVWALEDPLYEELIGTSPAGLVKEGAFIWAHPISFSIIRPVAKQYGFEYIYDDAFKMLAQNKLHVICGAPTLELPEYKRLEYTLKYDLKQVLYVNPQGADTLEIYGIRNAPFPDPVTDRFYFNSVEKSLESYPELLWAVFAGDESIEKAEKTGIFAFEKHSKDYKYLRDVNDMIKKNYGNGEYGIPHSPEDNNPYRWIAYRKWLVDQMIDRMNTLYHITKNRSPEIHVISYDSMSGQSPYDFSRWKGKCDILTLQLYPYKNPNRPTFGFSTKFVKDISGMEEVWPCVHVENYAASWTQEEVLELMSQVFRNGGTGFHLYTDDVIGKRSGKNYLIAECFGAPERWQLILKIIDEAGKINKLKFPTPDFAIMYSSDSYAAQGYGGYSKEIEYAYTFLGPKVRSWFSFIDDNIIERKTKDLSQFKVIYIPYAKYERLSTVKNLLEYVEKGGCLISCDPDVFSLDVYGNKIDSYREDLFGVKIKDRSSATSLKYNRVVLPTNNSAYEIETGADTTVLARFTNGEPAIVSHKYGKGRAIYFAANPFSIKNLSDEGWKGFFKTFQSSLGLKTDHDIWRFKFPNNLITPVPKPEGQCLTNNYIFWQGFEPLNIQNIDTKGDYTYSLKPDSIPDSDTEQTSIPFASGKLTNRFEATQAYSVVTNGSKKTSKLSEWIVRYKEPNPFEITFDFKKEFPINRAIVFFSGQLPEVELFGSKDGTKWEVLDKTDGPQDMTEDIHKIKLNGLDKEYRYIKFNFTERDAGSYLELIEIEVWTK